MRKNLTLAVEETLIKQCKKIAVDEDKSLSQWVAGLMKEAVERKHTAAAAKKRALARLKRGYDLGDAPFPREELHER